MIKVLERNQFYKIVFIFSLIFNYRFCKNILSGELKIVYYVQIVIGAALNSSICWLLQLQLF